MAWTAPRTWADGELPTASQFNVHFRDNLNVLAVHSHEGGSGSGAGTLGPLTGMTFTNTAAAAAIPTNAAQIGFYAAAGTVAWVNSASATYIAANFTHEHTLVLGTTANNSTGLTGTQNSGIVGFTAVANLATAAFTQSPNPDWGALTATVTIGGTGRFVAVVLAQAVHAYTASVGFQQGSIRLLQEVNGTGSSVVGSFQMTASGSVNQYNATSHIFSTVLTSGSYRYRVEYKGSAITTGNALAVSAPIITVIESRYTGG